MKLTFIGWTLFTFTIGMTGTTYKTSESKKYRYQAIKQKEQSKLKIQRQDNHMK